MIGNPRYGIVGLGVLPYVAFFEGLGPLLEVSGYVLAGGAALMGVLDWWYFWVLLGVSTSFGTAVTLLAVLLSAVATRRYMRGSDLARLILVVVLENVGYRQMTAWWGCRGSARLLTGKPKWGVMKRRAFKSKTM